MNRTISSLLSRRDVLRAGIAGGVAIALRRNRCTVSGRRADPQGDSLERRKDSRDRPRHERLRRDGRRRARFAQGSFTTHVVAGRPRDRHRARVRPLRGSDRRAARLARQSQGLFPRDQDADGLDRRRQGRDRRVVPPPAHRPHRAAAGPQHEQLRISSCPRSANTSSRARSAISASPRRRTGTTTRCCA